MFKLGVCLVLLLATETIQDSGSLESPSYPNAYPHNFKSRYFVSTYFKGSVSNLLNGQTAKRYHNLASNYLKNLVLKFDDFDVEGTGEACSGDYVALYTSRQADKLSGVCTATDPSTTDNIAIYCNSNQPPTQLEIYDAGVVVEFCTNGEKNSKGYKINWYSTYNDMNNVEVTVSTATGPQFITSPNYPNVYPAGSNVTYSIKTTNSANGIRVKTMFFDLEAGSDSCYFDYVEVRDVRHCGIGAMMGPNTDFDESTLSLSFISNGVVQRFGFNISVEAVTPASEMPTSLEITTPTTPVPATFAPTCNQMFMLSAVGDSASFWSPNYPREYGTDEDCFYNVSAPERSYIEFRFDSFDTEDYYDGLNVMYNDNMIDSISGHLGDNITVVFRTNEIVAEFMSDDTVVMGGFMITATAIEIPFGCNLTQYQCKGEKKCVGGDKRCDGSNDCADGSDEDSIYCNTTKVCGTQQVQPNIYIPHQTKVVGGSEAKPGTWPWTVSFHYVADNFQFCGGSLIGDQWLMSAAHCFSDGGDISQFKARIGSHDKDHYDAPYEEDIVLEAAFIHPLYNPNTNSYDISLVKLSKPIVLDKYINYACLPEPGYIVPGGTYCVISGWGTTQGTGSDEVMRQALVPIVPNDKCNDPYHYGGEIDETMVCAGYEMGGKDTCQGDSGGPLACPMTTDKDRFTVQGITSFGEGCAQPHHPGVYGRVSEFLNFIWKTMDEN